VTGAEALYADMGHFGPGPIRRAWLRFVFPALLLNYFAAVRTVAGNPEAIAEPVLPPWRPMGDLSARGPRLERRPSSRRSGDLGASR